MKKIILIAIAVFAMLIPVKAKHVYFNEGFENRLNSINLSAEDSKTDNILYWLQNAYFSDRFTDTGAVFVYHPGGGYGNVPDRTNTFVRIASSWQDLNGNVENYVSFNWTLETSLETLPSNVEIGIQARVSSNDDWTMISSIKGNQIQQLYIKTMRAKLPDALVSGADSIQIAMYYNYSTNSSLLFYMTFDNFSFVSLDDVTGSPFAKLSVISPEAIVGNISTYSVKANLLNESDVVINNVVLGYSVNDGDAKFLKKSVSPATQIFEQSTVTITASTFDFGAGENNVKMWIDSLNGIDIEELDIVNFSVTVPDKADAIYPTKYLVEHFTASTCPPCAGINKTMNPYYKEQDSAGNLIYIKYPTNWPGAGDPYYVREDISPRVGYYGVSGVPTMIGNGKSFAQSTGNLKSNIAAFINSNPKSFYNISIDSAYLIQEGEKTLYVSYKITSKITANVNIHTVIFENETYNNRGTNGETEFFHVTMKMFPDGKGNIKLLKKDSTYTFIYECDMGETFIEHISNLQMVVFIQNESTKEIYGAAQREINYTETVAIPEIVSEQFGDSARVTIECPTAGATIRYTINGLNPDDSLSSVYSAPFWIKKNTTIKAFAKNGVLPDSRMAVLNATLVVDIPNIAYRLVGDSIEFTITCTTTGSTIRYTKNNSTPSVSSNLYKAPFKIKADATITIRAIGLKTGWTSSSEAEQTISVANENLTNVFPIKIYPNPTSEYVNIESPENARIFLYNSVGTPVYESTIKAGVAKKLSIAKYATGIYVLKVISDKGTVTHKIIKN
jgi:thiol-disulfide isomerase/thioredoxin